MFEAAGPVRAQFLLGKAYYEATLFPASRGELPRSAAAAIRVSRCAPRIGKVYISLRRTDEAIRELELALKESPGDGDASYFLGGLLVQEERLAEVSLTSSGRRQVKPDFWAPYFYLGKARLGWNRRPKLWCCCKEPWS